MRTFSRITSILLALVMFMKLNISVCANCASKERIVELFYDVKIENGLNSQDLFKILYTETIIDVIAQLLCDIHLTEDELVSANGLNLIESLKNELKQSGCMWNLDKIGDSIKNLLNVIQRSNFSSKYKLVNYHKVGEFAIVAYIQYYENMPERKYYFLLSDYEMKRRLGSVNCLSSRNLNLIAFNKAIAKFCWSISVDELVDNKKYNNQLIELLKFISDFVEENIDNLPYKYSDIDLTADQYMELNNALVEKFDHNNLINKYGYKYYVMMKQDI